MSSDFLSRRRFLLGAGSLASAAALGLLPGGESLAQQRAPDYPFTLGVASGDPLPDGVVLWTRLAPRPLEPGGGMAGVAAVPVAWEVAHDEKMSRVVRRGTAIASPELAHSVHVEVLGLDAAREYFYRFTSSGHASTIGRTRTAPAPGSRVERLRFAFASCQDWGSGFYAAHRHLAEEDLDFVVFLGDYIYEYGIGAMGGARRVAVPDTLREECRTLERYRLQHALYKTDADLQLAHARFPWIVTWDDHEAANDYAGGPPHGSPTPAEFARERIFERRAAAYQAFYEHLPLRSTSLPRGPSMLLYRRLAWGDLAEMSVLDTRQYRSQPPCGPGEKDRCTQAFDPAVTMTGPDQERWLLDGLGRSRARWNIVAQQVLMAQIDHSQASGQKPGTKFWQDAWDGYPVARSRILSHLSSRRVSNPVVITGDWHSTFVNDLKADFANPRSATIATEFVCTSMSTNGDEEVYGPYYGPMVPHNPHVKYFDGDRRGYIRCDIGRGLWRSDLRMVSTVTRADAKAYTLASFAVESGRAGAQLDGIYGQRVRPAAGQVLDGAWHGGAR